MNTFSQRELTLDNEYAILETCFGWSSAASRERRSQLQDYLGLYRDQTAQLDLIYGPGGEKWPFERKEHQQLLEIVTVLRESGAATTKKDARHMIKNHLQLLNIEDYEVDVLIEAAIRVWTLVNFRRSNDSSVGRGRPCVEWMNDDSFATVLDNVFQKSTTELTLSQRRLSPDFTGANMINICGLKIEWASTLDDHLSLDRHRKILRIFPLRNWLKIQAEHASADGTYHQFGIQQSGPTTIPLLHAPLPKDLYDETSRTLDLLFPSWDARTQRYLSKRGKDFHIEHSNPRLLDLKHYSYWRDKLLELNEDIFLAPPEGWSQLWRDRRDPQKFWTFWIALMVLWLTMVGTAATIIQTWVTLARSG